MFLFNNLPIRATAELAFSTGFGYDIRAPRSARIRRLSKRRPRVKSLLFSCQMAFSRVVRCLVFVSNSCFRVIFLSLRITDNGNSRNLCGGWKLSPGKTVKPALFFALGRGKRSRKRPHRRPILSVISPETLVFFV